MNLCVFLLEINIVFIITVPSASYSAFYEANVSSSSAASLAVPLSDVRDQ